MRAFSAPTTFANEDAAVVGCHEFGRRIVDGQVPECTVEDLL
jgi:hypothetical protein